MFLAGAINLGLEMIECGSESRISRWTSRHDSASLGNVPALFLLRAAGEHFSAPAKTAGKDSGSSMLPVTRSAESCAAAITTTRTIGERVQDRSAAQPPVRLHRHSNTVRFHASFPLFIPVLEALFTPVLEAPSARACQQRSSAAVSCAMRPWIWAGDVRATRWRCAWGTDRPASARGTRNRSS